ncbi:HAD family phosphatase [[Mycoplasma] falconis]|uniref:HAD family phosphatase n=1 Tax=[Mycoplasma] falconis TaxID=92403 RepID=A0A501X899_9BACT|nr:HAD family hydrolase [[Mycoplasma] falconis]TPE56765.1 HAD family phosphatase [[Mycoplasma] falconis]
MIDFKPEAVFLDMDGTFLDLPKKPERISETNVLKAKEWNDNNRPVILSTGRSNSEFVMALANKINSPYVICQNGGIVVDRNNNVIRKCEIKKDTVIKIVEILKKNKMIFIFNSGDTGYAHGLKFKFVRSWFKRLNWKTYDEIQKLGNCTKILTFGTSKKNILKLRDELAAAFSNLSLHVVSKGYSIEINDINATKGIAEKFVCDVMNIDPKKAVHFGDSGNDTVTIPYVGAFIAMKNSMKNVKQQAKMITYSFKKAGVAKTLSEFEKIQN